MTHWGKADAVFNWIGMTTGYRLAVLRSHFRTIRAPWSRSFASANMANIVTLDQKYRMLSGHEIPILGYGVSFFFLLHSSSLASLHIVMFPSQFNHWKPLMIPWLIRCIWRSIKRKLSFRSQGNDADHVQTCRCDWGCNAACVQGGVQTCKRDIYTREGPQYQINPWKVDSARVYRNEGPCSEAIKKSGIPRSQIFFTTKVPPRSMSYDQTKAAIESSFKQTGLDYIDL